MRTQRRRLGVILILCALCACFQIIPRLFQAKVHTSMHWVWEHRHQLALGEILKKQLYVRMGRFRRLQVWSWRHGILWTWQNRYLWTCPFWAPSNLFFPYKSSKPQFHHRNNNDADSSEHTYNRTTTTIPINNNQTQIPRIIYVTGKFGPTPSHFQDEVMAHVQSIQKHNVFDEIFYYMDFPDFIWNDTTFQPHLQFRTTNPKHPSKRGAGWWFWKSVLIRHHLSELSAGDFLVYSDVDRPLEPWTTLIIETMDQRHANLAAEQMPFREWAFHKADSFAYICNGTLPESDQTGQYNANWLVVRKSAATENFVNAWVRACSNVHIISDEDSYLPENPGYYKHRRDQALFSALLKCDFEEKGKNLFPYTCLVDWVAYTFQLDRIHPVAFYTDHLH